MNLIFDLLLIWLPALVIFVLLAAVCDVLERRLP